MSNFTSNLGLKFWLWPLETIIHRFYSKGFEYKIFTHPIKPLTIINSREIPKIKHIFCFNILSVINRKHLNILSHEWNLWNVKCAELLMTSFNLIFEAISWFCVSAVFTGCQLQHFNVGSLGWLLVSRAFYLNFLASIFLINFRITFFAK